MESSSSERNQKELLSSLVSNIKNYDGNDPLRPWLQGIRKVKEALPPQILKEKLPRFLQKCAQSFESDRRYRNDSRYLRVWIQLMDYVDDAGAILRKMEKNHIGLKRAMFYSAYALYYEKHKKFEEAEKMYRLGVQNLAEPADELQKSYEQFLRRVKLLNERRARKVIPSGSRSSRIPYQQGETSQLPLSKSTSGGQKNAKNVNLMDMKPENTTHQNESSRSLHPNLPKDGSNLDKPAPVCSDDTVVVKFVGSAIIGKSEAEDACHHGLVDPTVNMKEAMNAISSMFREPLETEPVARRKPKENQQSNVLEVFVDSECSEEVLQTKKQTETKSRKPFVGAFKIWTEEDDDDDEEEDEDEDDNKGGHETTVPSETNTNKSEVRLTEDTVIRRFVGSTVFGDPGVENACHHGLVDPTINLKEAMDDINSMFGKPLNFVRASRSMRQAKPLIEQKLPSQGFAILADDDLEEDPRSQALRGTSSTLGGEGRSMRQAKPFIEQKQPSQGFAILADDDLEEDTRSQASRVTSSALGGEVRSKRQAKPIIEQKQPSQGLAILADDDLEEDARVQASRSTTVLGGDGDLFEPTVFTMEAMAEINEMFGKPLEF